MNPGNREDILPPNDPAFRGQVGKTVADSTPSWPEEAHAPQGAPNVIVILLDDLGFGQSSCYGGQINTPHIDRLAAEGLRYNNFHTTGLCSPSRAALLTGRNHHSVGFSTIAELSTGFPGSHGYLPRNCATLAEVLKQHRYNTMCVGKWHLAPAHHTTAAGPFDRWPLGLGFERFYGFLAGETDHWHPVLTVDNHRAPKPETGGYHFSEDMTDRAIGMLRDQQQTATGKPFFMYVAYGAPHCPLHVAPEWIAKYKGRFDAGWDAAREDIFARQKALGVVPADAKLPERNPGVKPWDTLDADEKKLYARLMEVFAGFVEHTDAQIGRLLDELKHLQIDDNTLVIFASDNGASQEGGSSGTLNTETFRNLVQMTVPEMLTQYDEIGGPNTDPHYPKGWGMAGNTPFKRWKRETHRGGNTDPLIVRWPARIKDHGAIRTQYHHLVDLYPTLLELIGLPVPTSVNGIEQSPLEGVSMAATLFDAAAPRVKKVQHYEMFGSRAIWADGWSAVTWHAPGTDWESEAWELYHTDSDFTQHDNLADSQPGRLAELKALWWQLAEKHKVLPLDDRGRERMIDPQRPKAFVPRPVYRYYAGTSPVPSNCRPMLINRSHRVTAHVETFPGRGDGVLMVAGSAISGWLLHIENGHVEYLQNDLKRHYSRVRAPQPLSPGKHVIEVEFTATARGEGSVRLLIDGAEAVGPTPMRTAQLMLSPLHEGLCVGRLWGSSPSGHDMHGPNAFQGEIDVIEIALGAMLDLPMLTGNPDA